MKKPPTLSEVINYFREVSGDTEGAKAFFERYEANGWTVTRLPTAETNWQPTRKPMKRWQGAAKAFIERSQQITKNRVHRKVV